MSRGHKDKSNIQVLTNNNKQVRVSHTQVIFSDTSNTRNFIDYCQQLTESSMGIKRNPETKEIIEVYNMQLNNYDNIEKALYHNHEEYRMAYKDQEDLNLISEVRNFILSQFDKHQSNITNEINESVKKFPKELSELTAEFAAPKWAVKIIEERKAAKKAVEEAEPAIFKI